MVVDLGFINNWKDSAVDVDNGREADVQKSNRRVEKISRWPAVIEGNIQKFEQTFKRDFNVLATDDDHCIGTCCKTLPGVDELRLSRHKNQYRKMIGGYCNVKRWHKSPNL